MVWRGQHSCDKKLLFPFNSTQLPLGWFRNTESWATSPVRRIIYCDTSTCLIIIKTSFSSLPRVRSAFRFVEKFLRKRPPATLNVLRRFLSLLRVVRRASLMFADLPAILPHLQLFSPADVSTSPNERAPFLPQSARLGSLVPDANGWMGHKYLHSKKVLIHQHASRAGREWTWKQQLHKVMHQRVQNPRKWSN